MTLDHKARAKVIGGSEAAAALGVNPFMTRARLFDIKHGGDVEPENDDMKRGKNLEDPAVVEYVEKTGARVRRMKHRVHPNHEFMGCTVDRQHLPVRPQDRAAEDEQLKQVIGLGTGLLEVKCPRLAKITKYRYEGLPDHIICQVQHNLAVTGYAWAVVVLFNAENWQCIHFVVMRGEGLIERIIKGVAEFVFDYWQAGVRPDEIEEEPELPITHVAGEAVMRDDEKWNDAAGAYIEADSVVKAYNPLRTTARELLLELRGDDAVVQGGGVRITPKKGSLSLDDEAFAKAHPDIDLSEFKVRGKPSANINVLKSRG